MKTLTCRQPRQSIVVFVYEILTPVKGNLQKDIWLQWLVFRHSIC